MRKLLIGSFQVLTIVGLLVATSGVAKASGSSDGAVGSQKSVVSIEDPKAFKCPLATSIALHASLNKGSKPSSTSQPGSVDSVK